ncbi:MAG: DinB family protein, partial [Vicinamibacterales bacterium]
MHSYLTDVFSRMDSSRARLRAAVDSVPAALRATRHAPDCWSVAEVLEHLARVERRYIAINGVSIAMY